MMKNLRKQIIPEDARKSIQTERKLNKQSKSYYSSENSDLQDAETYLSNLKEIHDVLSWTWEDWKFLLAEASIKDAGRIFSELVTKKKLKSAEKKYEAEIKKDKAAEKVFNLTGSLPGKVSGVVKNENAANKKAAEYSHKLKIHAAMMLAYGKDDKLKRKVMKEVESKYPEIAKDIRVLAREAKERTGKDEFKKSTAGLKFGKPKKIFNEFGEVIRGGR
jgi:hypothetical protein